MTYDRILIRYGEISIKGRNRNKFIERLKRSIQLALVSYPKIKVEFDRDRMFILLNGEDEKEIMHRLRKIFGLQSFSPVIKVEKNIENMKEAALSLFRKVYKEGQTFKITGRRADKSFELDTDGINHTFGAHLLKNIPGLSVNVKKPDINLQIEIRSEAAYISCETILGAGGLPIGSSGKAMLMLSGGIDSPVAGYLTMRRGVEIEAVHFYSPPYTSERAKQKVIDLSKKLAEIAGSLTLHIVPFTEIQEAVQKQVPENYSITTTRRLMLQITDEIRRRQEGLAVITGESIGQVASQTLESMVAINDVTNTPVIRPLIAMDKTEIIKIAHKIETHDISIRPFEDCCTIFVPASPKTKPRKEKAQFYESFVDFTPLIEKAVKGIETLHFGISNQENNIISELF